MRMLNHNAIPLLGLFVGDTRQITTKNLAQLKKGSGENYIYVSQYLAEVFIEFFDLIVHDVIYNRVRFQAPYNDWYIDFDIAIDEELMVHRQNGRMKTLDIVESDFTGYQLTLYNRVRRRENRFIKYNIYLDPRQNKELMDYINEGNKLYSTTTKYINDYLPILYEKFTHFTETEIKKLIHFTVRRISQALKRGTYLSFVFKKRMYYIGSLVFDVEDHFKRFFRTMEAKYRVMAAWEKSVDWDDNKYYIGLDRKMMHDWAKDNRRSKTRFRFDRVYARKLIDVVKYNSTDIYIFETTIENCTRWNNFIRDEIMFNVKYVGHGINYTIYEPECTVIQLKNKFLNEERND